jgi:hypothetical protein
MAKQPNSIAKVTNQEGPSKRELQKQIDRTRESLSETVEEIKETAEQGYASVKETVSGVLDYRDEFQKEPLVWSLGALSAGFGLGYAVGYAHKFSTKKGGNSQVAQFTGRMVDELSKIGQSLVVPALGTKISEFFGLDFGQLLHDMGGARKSTRRKSTSGIRRNKSRPRKKGGTRKSKSRK